MAAVLLGLLMACFATTIQLISRMQREFGREQLALVALDNVVERLAAEPHFDSTLVSRLAAAEFARSSLVTERGIVHRCEFRNGQMLVTIMDETGKLLADVRIPCRE